MESLPGLAINLLSLASAIHKATCESVAQRGFDIDVGVLGACVIARRDSRWLSREALGTKTEAIRRATIRTLQLVVTRSLWRSRMSTWQLLVIGQWDSQEHRVVVPGERRHPFHILVVKFIPMIGRREDDLSGSL